MPPPWAVQVVQCCSDNDDLFICGRLHNGLVVVPHTTNAPGSLQCLAACEELFSIGNGALLAAALLAGQALPVGPVNCPVLQVLVMPGHAGCSLRLHLLEKLYSFMGVPTHHMPALLPILPYCR